MVIFGAAGDLTRRKLIPALYNLAKRELLSASLRSSESRAAAMTTEEFRKKVSEDIKQFARDERRPRFWDWFCSASIISRRISTTRISIAKLKDSLEKVDKEHSTHRNYFYLPGDRADYFGPIVEQLAAVGLMDRTSTLAPSNHRKAIRTRSGIGQGSNQQLLRVADEKQIYRIDHYLGKETVQNILAFRFANGIFEPIWNRRYIDHVQISVAETVGVEQRGGYYDQAGALRDMVPNHIMQLISLTAMEPPISFDADAVRDEQAKILHAIQPLTAEDVLSRTVRGQYGDGS